MKAITSCCVVRSMSSIRAMSNPPRSRMSRAAEGGTIPLAEAALVAGIEAGQSYFNIHTVMFSGGEIRSQLFALGAVGVPGPTAGAGLSGLLAACGALLLLARRRQKAT